MTPHQALAVSPKEAAAMLGISRSTFDRKVIHQLRVTRISSRRVLIPISELERWLDEHATSIHDDHQLMRRIRG